MTTQNDIWEQVTETLCKECGEGQHLDPSYCAELGEFVDEDASVCHVNGEGQSLLSPCCTEPAINTPRTEGWICGSCRKSCVPVWGDY